MIETIVTEEMEGLRYKKSRVCGRELEFFLFFFLSGREERRGEERHKSGKWKRRVITGKEEEIVDKKEKRVTE